MRLTNTAEDCKVGRQEPTLRRSILMRVDVGALKEGTRPTAMHRFTNGCSLNDNANVRKCLNENIYTPGVFDLELKGGLSCGL